MTNLIENVENAKLFVMGGRSLFTVVSKQTGKRFTFKVAIPSRDKGKEDTGHRYVSVRDGESYTYLGNITNGKFWVSKKLANEHKMMASAFFWVYGQLFTKGEMHTDQMEFWHEGRCAKCAKPLTDPRSIKIGFGPICEKGLFICN